MFEHFVKRPFHRALYRNGPYAEERRRFLAHLVQEGRCFERLQRFNWFFSLFDGVDIGTKLAGTFRFCSRRWSVRIRHAVSK